MLAVSSTSFVRALVVLAATTIAQAATDAAYSYDLSKATGPQFWAQLDIPDNQCGGDSNSPNNKDHFLSTSKRRAKTGMERDDIYNLNLVQ